MSGGIDSTVSAILLREQGYDLVGCTFRTFDSMKDSCISREKGCCTIESIMEAKKLAQSLGFEHHIVDFRDIFAQQVIRNFTEEYRHGRTPNPCVLCNKTIKWGAMLQLADEWGCEMIATGHYARIAERDGQLYLRRAADVQKDQTYFLWTLTHENLQRTIFPLGDFTKAQVRQMAADRGYIKLSQKTESQDICFIPDGDYRSFLLAQAQQNDTRGFTKGTFIDAAGRTVGQHEGFANYTIGQRKGLGVALGYPAFVTRIDAEHNTVQLGTREELYTHDVHLSHVMFRADATKPIQAQIRFRSTPSEAIFMPDNTPPTLRFNEPVWAVTRGQSAVMYQDDLLVGGGIIE